MSYIGQQPLNNFVTKQSQEFTPDGSTTGFTLNFAVTSGTDILLMINNVVQEPGSGNAYTASGTTLTMSEAPSASDSMYCIFLGLALQTVNPGDGSVGTAKLVDSAVTTAKINDDAITTAKINDGAITTAKLNSEVALGKILQVKSTTITDTVSINTLAYADVTDLSVSITPSSTSSKIFIICSINFGQGTAHGTFRLVRGSTAIGIGDTAGSRTTGTFVMHTGVGAQQDAGSTNFLDSPATTSATTYKLQGRSNDAGTAMYINRSNTDSDSAAYQRTSSTITVMEVSG